MSNIPCRIFGIIPNIVAGSPGADDSGATACPGQNFPRPSRSGLEIQRPQRLGPETCEMESGSSVVYKKRIWPLIGCRRANLSPDWLKEKVNH